MKPERKPRAKRKPWAKYVNVTISLEPGDEVLLRVLCARYKVRAVSHAMRHALRELTTGAVYDGEKEELEGTDDPLGRG